MSTTRSDTEAADVDSADANIQPDRRSEAGGAHREPGSIPPTRIRLTGAALGAIRKMMAEEEVPPEGGLRLTARTGAGCSAPTSYSMIFEAAPEPEDHVLEYGGVRLLLDPENAWALDGLIVDYVTDSPMGEGFAFRRGRACGGPSC